MSQSSALILSERWIKITKASFQPLVTAKIEIVSYKCDSKYDFKAITWLTFINIIKELIDMFQKVHHFLTSIVELPDRLDQFFGCFKSCSFWGSISHESVRFYIHRATLGQFDLESEFLTGNLLVTTVDSGFLRCTQQMESRSKSCDILLTQDLLHRALSDLPVKETVFGHF